MEVLLSMDFQIPDGPQDLGAKLNTLPALIVTLKELKSSDATCEGLLVRIGCFEFLQLQLLILKECFEF